VKVSDILKVNELSVSYYHGVRVLNDISFKLADGEVLGIIGANGAGKSTLLNAIIGTIRSEKGSIIFNGMDVTRKSVEERVGLGMAMVPERRRIIPYLTVLENLKLGAYTSKARKVWKETLKNVFEIFPVLKERKNQIAHTLSGGEQQMLAIGRALMARPRLILLDEISLGLAPIVVARIYDALKEINDKDGVSMIVVEQYINRVVEIADNIIILRRGRVVDYVKPKELDVERIREKYFGL
jgi:branched-chain amino acid transport system ATP-binding protein